MRNRTNKQLVIGMAVLISLVMIGIGGKVYMDNREERKAQELLAVEKQSVRVLKNTFADIAEIKFEGSAKNDMTGSYRLFVTMKI
ncbi:membrane protein [Enterococcus mundtii QU 25]|nr:membrane protein [Enterococcus mundtii QU 25]